MSRISEKTLEEHAALVALCGRLHEALANARAGINSAWLQDYDLFDWLVLQSQSLGSVVTLALEGRYRDAYHVCRLALESYLLLRIVWTCPLYRQRWLLKPKAGETITQAQSRFIADVRRDLGSSLIDIETTGPRAKEVTLVRRIGQIVDEQGNDSGRYMPFYWHAWKLYRAEHFVKRDKLRGKLFLLPEWAPGRRKGRGRNLDERDRDFYRHLFNFDAMLNILRLNKMLTKKTALRVAVHYNFLSGYSHTTMSGFDTLKDRSGLGFTLRYDHYHSELALLYAAHLAVMHFGVIGDYFKATEVDTSGLTLNLQRFSDEVNQRFGYFWFVVNDPHEYDHFEHANRKSDWSKKSFVRPHEIRPSLCRYYDDPLARLKRLHWTTQELSTGNAFISPFPRDDAWR